MLKFAEVVLNRDDTRYAKTNVPISLNLNNKSSTNRSKKIKMFKLVVICIVIMAIQGIEIDPTCVDKAVTELCLAHQPADFKECYIEHQK